MDEAWAWLQVVLDETDEPLIGIDTTGQIVFCNNPAAALLGQEAVRLTGTRLLIRAADGAAYASGSLFAANHGTPVAQRVRVSIGEISHAVTARFSQVRDRAGGVCGGLLLLEAETRPDDDEQDDPYTRMKIQLLRAVSHELRSPLSIIKGFSSSLLASDVTFDAERQRKFITVIDETADRMQVTVDRMRDYAQLEAGVFRMNFQPVRLQAIIEGIMPRLREITQNHQFVLQPDEQMQRISGDVGRIEQVLLELVSNAVKFSPPGTTIALATEQRGTRIEVRVQDEGHGIAPEAYSRVFEPFWQPEGETRQKGAGLGLALVKGIVELHGGNLRIEPGAHVGTTIIFTMPTLHS